MPRAYRNKFKVCNDEFCIHESKPQPLNMFQKQASCGDGYGGKCKTCRNTRQRAREERISLGPWIASPNATIGGFVGFRVGSI